MKITDNKKTFPAKKGLPVTAKTSIFSRYSYLIIIITGFVLYAHTLKFDYTNMDDKTLIADDKAFVSKLSNIPKAFKLDVFKEKEGTFYRPLFVTSLIIDGSIGNMSFTFYHYSNILFHLLSACLLFSLLLKLGLNRESSLLLTLFFTVHPALVQAVAWIPGRNDSLLAVFALLSFLMMMNYIKSKKIIHLVLHFIFFAMALFTKETAIVLPLLYLILLNYFGEGKLFSRQNSRYFIFWIFWVIILFFARNNAIQTSKGANPVAFLANIPNNLSAFFLYVGKIFLPFNLSVIPTIADSTILYGILTILIILGIFFLSKTKFSALAIFGGSWFILFIIPVLVVPKESAFFYEQRLYLPLMGILILLGQIIINTSQIKLARYFSTSLILLIIIFVPINIMYSKNFSDKINFWNNAIETSPNSVFVNKIAASVFYIDKNIDKAETLYLKAQQLNPLEPSINNDLGIIYRDKQQWDKAIEFFKKETELSPDSDKANYNLAYAYYNIHKLDEAEKYFEQTIKINSEYTDAYQSLAMVNAELKNFERARYYTAEAQKRGVTVPPEFLKAIQ